MNLDANIYEHTFGIAQGCCKISPGCAHCYAEEDAQGWGLKVDGISLWGKDAPRKTHGEKHWKAPLEWNADANFWIPADHAGKLRPLVFSSPMCDVFEDHRTINQEREKLWDLICWTPNLDWHIATKRAENIERNLPWGKTDAPWPNVWISVSIENDYWAKKRLPFIANLNVAVRGTHLEPLLGPVPSLAQYISQLDWVLVGGESCDSDFAKARIMQPSWVREVKDICDAAGVPFFFKQWGSHKPTMQNGKLTFVPMHRLKAGNKINGVIYHPWPTPKIGKPR